MNENEVKWGAAMVRSKNEATRRSSLSKRPNNVKNNGGRLINQTRGCVIRPHAECVLTRKKGAFYSSHPGKIFSLIMES